MARGVSNLSGISNNDLALLRKNSQKHDKFAVKVGSARLDIEGVEASLIKRGDLLFVSIPATQAIYKRGELLSDEAELKNAIQALRATQRKGTLKAKSDRPQLSEELRLQLEAFTKQTQSRVVLDPSGSGYRVQKLRPRNKPSN